MARTAEVQIGVEEWVEGEEAARTPRSRGAAIIHPNAGGGGGGGGSGSSTRRSPHQQRPPTTPMSSPTGSSHSVTISQVAPVQVGATPSEHPKLTGGGFSRKLWKILFLLHLVVMLVLVIFLAVRGFTGRRRSFHPAHWYPPLLVAAAAAVVFAAAWLIAAIHNVSVALRACFWLAPFFTFAVSILLFTTADAAGLAFAALGLIFAILQSLYACWATPRLAYASEILAASLSATNDVLAMITGFVAVSLAAGLVWSGLWILGVGGVAGFGPRFAGLYIVMLLLTMAWTMHVLRNIVTVSVSGYAYIRLGRGANMNPAEAWRNAWTISLASVCLGSAVVPVVGTIRDAARAMHMVAGDADEFLFSCTSCFMGVADRLIAYGNRWGFVQVGVYDKGFVTASEDTWVSFLRLGMERVIDVDLTSSFCFLSGVAGGAASALLGGVWVHLTDRSYVTAVALYAFVIGYFLNRIAMAWPQACVSALHVAYAENTEIPPQFGAPITHKLRSLQRA